MIGTVLTKQWHRWKVSRQQNPLISSALGLATHQRDHLAILLRNIEDREQLGSRRPADLPALIRTINYSRDFKVLKLVKYARAKVDLFVYYQLFTQYVLQHQMCSKGIILSNGEQ